jgi:hypothetical protein
VALGGLVAVLLMIAAVVWRAMRRARARRR